MEDILYSYFISEYRRNQGKPISYQRIHRLLSHIAADIDSLFSTGSLYRLLQYGVIDYAADNCFSLSASAIIEGEKHKVGVNLNFELINANADKVLQSSNLGLTIFRNEDITLEMWDVPIKKYDFESYWHQFKGLHKIAGTWDASGTEVNLNNAELYEADSFGWSKIPDSMGNGLYRLHTDYKKGDMKNVEYHYRERGKTLLIRKEEIERLNLVKTILSAHKLCYYTSKAMIIIPDYFYLPTLIERLFVLHHMIITGSFPLRRDYHISNADFRWLNKNIFNNEIKTYHE